MDVPMTRIFFGMLASLCFVVAKVAVASPLPEYSAAEAKKHVGERATVVGTVDDIGHGRRHIDLIIGGSELRKAQLWVVVPNEASGPELDSEQLRGVTIAVTGKIESSGGTPQIRIKSTTDIQARSALKTNYIGRAYDKEQRGDIDGAIEDMNQAIEHQPARRDEACEHLARLKEKRGDWAGALAAYDRLVSFYPNKSGSYYVRATAKKQHGDFEGAMADFTRAAELRSSGIGYVEIGNMRKAQGDTAGAMVEYDRAISVLDRQIAGTEKRSDRLDLLHYQRGVAKELKGDLDGALNDYSQAILIEPNYEAMAFSRRGDIKKARGDLPGAIADYEHAVQYAQLAEDKEKLKKAKAEGKTLAKNVATPPNLQAAQNEATSDLAIKQRVLGYWKFPKAVCYIAADGTMHVGPRKNETEKSRWNVRNGHFYWGNVTYTIVTLTDDKFVFQEKDGQKYTFTLIRSTKAEVGPD